MAIKEPEAFFNCVRSWSFGKRRKINGYYSNINVKITDSQKESIKTLVKEKSLKYETQSEFVRKAIDLLLELENKR